MDKPDDSSAPGVSRVDRLIPLSTPAHQALLADRRRELSAWFSREVGAGWGGRAFVWEVGCGHGHFLAAYAAAHPDEICVGVDIASDRVARALRKRDRARLANLHFVQAEARLFLEVIPPALRFTRVFILFPDPWPKSRHHKHRVMQQEFLAWLAKRMQPDCRLYFRTDHVPYFEDTLRLVESHPHWMATGEPWAFEQETVFQTRAESHRSLVARLRGPA